MFVKLQWDDSSLVTHNQCQVKMFFKSDFNSGFYFVLSQCMA